MTRTADRLRAGLAAAFLLAAFPARAEPMGSAIAQRVEQRISGLEEAASSLKERLFGAERPRVQSAQLTAPDLSVRLNRLEEQMRQLNGRTEELQFQIRRMEEQLKRFQGDVDFRMQELEGGRGGARRPAAPTAPAGGAPGPRRSDAAPGGADTLAVGSLGGERAGPPAGPPGGLGANAASDPTRPAPGPQTLGSLAASVAGPGSAGPGGPPPAVAGAPASDAPGAPLVIAPEIMTPGVNAPAGSASLPRPAPTPVPGGPHIAAAPTAAPSAAPEDELALAQGFLQRRDYELAEVQFKEWLRAHPADRRAPDALYGLAESFYARKRYSDALEPYLKVVTEHGSSGRAPDSMLRLGMTLAAIDQREQACATLAELPRKYPRAANAKAQAEREMQRAKC